MQTYSLKGEEIVISGISGRFPEANNVEEFWHKLITGQELYSCNDRRWPVGYMGLPSFSGKVSGEVKCDAEFFKLHKDECKLLDPQYRMALEVVYEAIYDAGIIPESLKGSKTAVIVGKCFYASGPSVTLDLIPVTNQDIFHTECIDIIPQVFELVGPAYEIDTACASSYSCFHEGLLMMNAGICENLIIGGFALHMVPMVTKTFQLMRMISPDGRSKCLDESVNGYCRSEAIVVLFLQRRSQAKRIYASILCCNTNTDGFKPEGITFPRYDKQKELLEYTIEKSGIDPYSIDYIEAHVTGTAVGDPVECKAILDSYRKGSLKPIMFGCLKSNIGHTEGASGNCALAKVALIFQKHLIPPNINFKKANPNIEGLIQKQIIPVLDKTPFDGDIIPVNSFGFGGVNVHGLFKANEKKVTEDSYKIIENIPRLVNISGRTEKGIYHTIDWIQANRKDVTKDFLALLNDVSKSAPETGMIYRGFAIFDEENILKKKVGCIEKRKPLWFIFSPLGCQWKGMAKGLMTFKPFADSIYKSAFALKSVNIDLMQLFNDTIDFESDLTFALVSIVSIQIALIDILRFIGVEADGIIGYSIGELAAGYTDRCLTEKEAVLIAYNVAKCSLAVQREKGLMAAIGMSWEEAKRRCPSGVYPACDDSDTSVIIAGSETNVEKFLEELTKENIFAKPIASCNMAFHCPLLNDSYQSLFDEFSKIIKTPKNRSAKWFSSSSNKERLCDAQYYAPKVMAPVFFREAAMKIPKDACVVEIGPSAILLQLVKKYLQDGLCIPMLKKNSDVCINDILQGIGEIYISGNNPKIENLYPKVEYPVPRETASLSHLLKWNHSESHFIAKFPEYYVVSKPTLAYEIDLMKNDNKFIEDHCIDGKTLFPATGYLYYVWLHFSVEKKFENVFQTPVEFRNVTFHRAILVQKGGICNLEVAMDLTTQRFTVTEKGFLCVSGTISFPNEFSENINIDYFIDSDQTNILKLDRKDFYKELRVRGYDYGPGFQGMVEANCDGSKAKVKWTGHWISFTDAMLQLSILASEERKLRVPTFIEYMRCDPQIFFKAVENQKFLNVYFDKYANIGHSKGIIIKGMRVSTITRRLDSQKALLEDIVFISYDGHVNIDEKKVKDAQTYFNHCANLVRKITAKEYDLTESEKKTKFIDTFNKKYSLYQKLADVILENKEIKDFCEQLTLEDKDLTFFKLSHNELIRDFLHTMIENKDHGALTIVEYNRTPFNYQDDVIAVSNALLTKCHYTLLPSTIGEKTIPIDQKNVSVIIFKHHLTDIILNNIEEQTEEECIAFFDSCYTALKNGGFLLCHYRQKFTSLENELFKALNILAEKVKFETYFKKYLKDAKFKLICEKSDDFGLTSILLRKIQDHQPLSDPIVIESKILEYDWIEKIKVELKQKSDNRIWIKAKDSEINGVIGMIRCLRRELGGDRIRCILSDDENIPQCVLEKDLAINIFRKGIFGHYVNRMAKEETRESEHAYLDVKTKGDLTSFQWFEAPHKHWLKFSSKERDPKMTMLYVYYSALNFKDVMVATGRITEDAYPNFGNDIGSIGFEYSGIDEDGQRICGFFSKNAMATTMMIRKDGLYFDVPDNWTLEEAVTVPVVYATVYFGLIIRASLKSGETVLIHAGSGGVGQAAINICLSMGCEVFTSVGTEEKKQFLKSLFPQLEDKHFVNSRDLKFEEHILKETNGRGVDIILNSLAEEKLRASIKCLADFGRFVEIGKYDLMQNNPFDPSQLSHNKTFHVVCVAHLLDEVSRSENSAKQMLAKKIVWFVSNGMKTGLIKPLKHTVFNHDEAEKAFRFMASGKHIGKVVLKIRDEDPKNNIPTPMRVKAFPQTYSHPFKVYILIGGLGGIGLELAYWLIKRGAKKIVLTSRFGIKNSYQRFMINKFEAEGAKVIVAINDATTYDSALKLLKEAQKFGRVGGIFNLALVLSDGLIESLTPESFEKVCFPKVNTTLYLDQISRKMCPELEYFVCISSVAVRGNPGQSNYAFANSVMESICEKRRADGLHGIAIEWGAVGDVGFVMENYNINEVVIRGTVPQRIPSCMAALDMFLNSSQAVCSSIVPVDNLSCSSTGKGDLLKVICHVLGVKDHSSLEDKVTLGELGLDSLMAVEIQQRLERDYNTVITTQEIRQLKIKDIRELSSKKSKKDENAIINSEGDIEYNPFELPEHVFTKLDKGEQGIPLFFFPPIEGNFSLMKPLVKYLTRPVIGVNWTEEVDEMETIEEIAAFYVQKLRDEHPLPEYDIVGYSFGSLIALEVCLQLQKIDSRLIKRLILLDGDPKMLKKMSFNVVNNSNEETEFFDSIMFFVSLFYPFESVDILRRQIQQLKTKDEQMNKTIEFIKQFGGIDCSVDILNTKINRYLRKAKRINLYNPSSKFKGELKLINSTSDCGMALNTEENEMQKMVDGKVEVLVKKGDHKTFLMSNYEEIGNFIEALFYCIQF